MKKTYSEKLKDPRWQKKRLEVLEAAGWKCNSCGCAEKELHVHHPYYEKGKAPWEYDNLIAMCSSCHERVGMATKIVSELLSNMPEEQAYWLALMMKKAFDVIDERELPRRSGRIILAMEEVFKATRLISLKEGEFSTTIEDMIESTDDMMIWMASNGVS